MLSCGCRVARIAAAPPSSCDPHTSLYRILCSTHHGRLWLDILDDLEVVLLADLDRNVVVDGKREDLGANVAAAEVEDDLGVLGRQPARNCMLAVSRAE